ncbi:hypothetical protein F383_11183 [Gossypium arboreum]|uniref:Uncharacterized protein n=1 Tax=Gossypium arboreum TaxID=29729 RepID=A0A0B0MZM5_GOSAR|nr:hypothetical protein F383_31454 [Gossypium arboreum]KHG11325.1 hypothetical protein F383_11183 [Gossypium arboreum]
MLGYLEKLIQCQRSRHGLTCNQISMPPSQTGFYTKSNTMLMSQTSSYMETHIGSYVMTYVS